MYCPFATMQSLTPRIQALRSPFARVINAYIYVHRVSKTSHLWLAITLAYMNGFWYSLAEMLPIK